MVSADSWVLRQLHFFCFGIPKITLVRSGCSKTSPSVEGRSSQRICMQTTIMHPGMVLLFLELTASVHVVLRGTGAPPGSEVLLLQWQVARQPQRLVEKASPHTSAPSTKADTHWAPSMQGWCPPVARAEWRERAAQTYRSCAEKGRHRPEGEKRTQPRKLQEIWLLRF